MKIKKPFKFITKKPKLDEKFSGSMPENILFSVFLLKIIRCHWEDLSPLGPFKGAMLLKISSTDEHVLLVIDTIIILKPWYFSFINTNIFVRQKI